jgi:hypothetical protein
MKRVPVKCAPEPAYPSVRRLLCEGRRALRFGLVAGTLLQVGCPAPGGTAKDTGDTVRHIDGDIVDTSSNYHEFAVLLPADGTRLLYLNDPYGHVRYRLELVVTEDALAVWLNTHTKEALVRADEVLARHALSDLEPKDDLTAIQEELLQALADLWWSDHGKEGTAPLNEFASFVLVIEEWAEDAIDGDMAMPR